MICKKTEEQGVKIPPQQQQHVDKHMQMHKKEDYVSFLKQKGGKVPGGKQDTRAESGREAEVFTEPGKTSVSTGR